MSERPAVLAASPSETGEDACSTRVHTSAAAI